MSGPRRVRVELALASLLAGLWCALLSPAFTRNAPTTDLLLFALYLAAYLSVCAPLCLALGRLRRALPGAPRPSASPLLTALGLATIPIVLLGFALHRLPLSRAEVPDEPAPSARAPLLRVQLVGMDGVDPDLLARLIAEGELPAFARMQREGVSGRLTTVSPHSPVVWTSIATGAPPERHGVQSYTTDFLRGSYVTAPDHPLDLLGRALEGLVGYRERAAVSSNERRVKALWEILSERGRSSLVINWWATYPAETIDGIVVSNRAIPWGGFRPEELALLERTSDLVSPAEILPMVRRAVHEVVEERAAGGVRGQTFRYFEVRDEIALRLFERLRDPSFALATVYVQGADTGSHAWTNAVFGGPSERPATPQVTPERAQELFELLVEGPYRRLDATLRGLRERLPPDAALIVLSDHGWRYDGTGHLDPPPGIFLASGAPFRAGATLEGHVYDVLPTIAWLLGVPRSRELPGRVLREALVRPPDPGALATVSSYGPRRARTQPLSPGSDRAHIERLRALGYVE